MRLSVLASLTPYVTSSFQSHSLLTVINIVSSSMAAASYIPIAKLLDVWGRAEGFLLMVVIATIGLILMPVSNNLATFCAAQVRIVSSHFVTPLDLIIWSGLLQCWLRRRHIHHRRSRSRYHKSQESRSCFCLHFIALYDYSVCRFQGSRRFPA